MMDEHVMDKNAMVKLLHSPPVPLMAKLAHFCHCAVEWVVVWTGVVVSVECRRRGREG